MKTMDINAIRRSLAEQTPFFDELFLKDWITHMDHPSPIPIDVRLLPNELRRQWIKFRTRPSLYFNKKGRVKQKYRKLHESIRSMLSKRLDKWLSTLPARDRKKETKCRQQQSWIGRHKTAKWSEANDKRYWDRVRAKQLDYLSPR